MYSNFEYFKEDRPKPSNIDLQIPVIKNAKTFSRYCVMQGLYFRLSSENKCAYLKRCFDIIKDYKYTQMCFEIIYRYNLGKMRSYLTTIGISDFSYDNILRDHNRMLNEPEISESINDSLNRAEEYTWDETLSVFTTALALGGGGIIQLICQHMRDYYKKKSLASLKGPTGDKNEIDFTLFYDSSNYIEDWDKTDPEVIEIYKKRKQFNDTMAKYRKKVEKSLGLAKPTQNPEKSPKMDQISKKSSKASKKSEKSSKKSSKKGKKTKKPTKTKPEIDFIQRLPIGLTKKIFSFLDNKTLNKVKKVNKYWEFAVESTKKDAKARKSFDKFISKMEMDIGLTTSFEPLGFVYTPKSMLMRVEDRLKREGAVCKNILKSLPPIPENLKTYQSLFSEMVTEIPDLYSVPVTNLHCFAKMKCTETASRRLHNKPPCVRFDGNKRPVTPYTQLPPIGDKVETISSINISDFATSLTDLDGLGDELSDEDHDLVQMQKRRSKRSLAATSSIGIIYSTHKYIEDAVRKVNFSNVDV